MLCLKKINTGKFCQAILFWPAMATTFANADKAIKAANDRTYYLLKIMKDKNCKNVDLVNSRNFKKFKSNHCWSIKYFKRNV